MAKRRRRVGYGITDKDRFQMGMQAINLGSNIYSGIKDRQLADQRIAESRERTRGVGLSNEQVAYDNEYISMEKEDLPYTARMYKNQGVGWTDDLIAKEFGADIVMDGKKRTVKRGIYRQVEKRLRSDPNFHVTMATRKLSKGMSALNEVKKINVQEKATAKQWSPERTARYEEKLAGFQAQQKKIVTEAIGVAKGLKGEHKAQLIGNISKSMALRGMTLEKYEKGVVDMVKDGTIDTLDASMFIDNFNKTRLAIETEKVDAEVRSADIAKNILDQKKAKLKGEALPSEEEVRDLPTEQKLGALGLKAKAEKPPRIIKGADGYNYNLETGERALPGVEKPTKAEKPPYTVGKRTTFTKDGLKKEGTYRGQDERGEPVFSNVTNVPVKDKGKTAASKKRQWRLDTDKYINDFIKQIPEEEMDDKQVRKLKSQIMKARRKYRDEAPDVAFEKATEDVMPEEVKSKPWYSKLIDLIASPPLGLSADFGSEEAATTPSVGATDEEIRFTAEKYNMSEDEVRETLRRNQANP